MADGWTELAWDPLSATQSAAAMAEGGRPPNRRPYASSSARLSFFLPSSSPPSVSSSSSSSPSFLFFCQLLLLQLFSHRPGIIFGSPVHSHPMPNRKGKSIQYDIVQHEDELRPLCDDGGNIAPRVGEGIRRLDGIKKAAKKLLLLPIRKLEIPNGQTTRRRRRMKNKTNGNQVGWPSNHPPPMSRSFEGSTISCCLPIGWNHRRSPLVAVRKPPKYQIFLRSFIEQNHFYCKDCNVYLKSSGPFKRDQYYILLMIPGSIL